MLNEEPNLGTIAADAAAATVLVYFGLEMPLPEPFMWTMLLLGAIFAGFALVDAFRVFEWDFPF